MGKEEGTEKGVWLGQHNSPRRTGKHGAQGGRPQLGDGMWQRGTGRRGVANQGTRGGRKYPATAPWDGETSGHVIGTRGLDRSDPCKEHEVFPRWMRILWAHATGLLAARWGIDTG